jgi:hypothetical protein
MCKFQLLYIAEMMEGSVKIIPILAKDPNDGAYGRDLT